MLHPDAQPGIRRSGLTVPALVIPSLVRGRLHYAWVVFGVTFFTLLAAAGIRSTPGVLIVPLQQDFGWTRAEISVAVSINLLLFGLSGPFAAAFMNRFG